MQKFVFLLLAITTAVSTTTNSPCDQLRLASSYDAIVVGTGLGGSVAARRLAEWNPNWNILLIERGSSYAMCPACASSVISLTFQSDPITGNYISSTVQPALNNQSIAIKDTAVQGGGTSINAMFHIRGDAVRLFDEYFPANWNALTMIPFFERYENYTFPPGFHRGVPWTYASDLRGNSGPVVASQQGPFSANTNFLNALQAVYPNMPISYDTSLNDGFMPGIGASYPESSTNGPKRVSAYSAYIQSYTGSNIKAITGTLATKILFDSSAEVTGVQVMFTRTMATQMGLGNQTLATCNISTTRVVAASGAIGTPKLLKLSGIGSAAELSQVGIPVVSNVPAVGQNLRDHLTVVLPIVPKNSSVQVPYSTNSINNYGWAFFNANDSVNVPNDFTYEHQSFDNYSMIDTIAGTNLKSSGTVKLRSADPTADPLVNPNYLGNPADRYVRQISHLYVLDASIMPYNPPSNLQASLYAVSERGIDMINANMHSSYELQDVEEAAGWIICEFAPDVAAIQ